MSRSFQFLTMAALAASLGACNASGASQQQALSASGDGCDPWVYDSSVPPPLPQATWLTPPSSLVTHASLAAGFGRPSALRLAVAVQYTRRESDGLLHLHLLELSSVAVPPTLPSDVELPLALPAPDALARATADDDRGLPSDALLLNGSVYAYDDGNGNQQLDDGELVGPMLPSGGPGKPEYSGGDNISIRYHIAKQQYEVVASTTTCRGHSAPGGHLCCHTQNIALPAQPAPFTVAP
jgi:hypothetical protein